MSQYFVEYYYGSDSHPLITGRPHPNAMLVMTQPVEEPDLNRLGLSDMHFDGFDGKENAALYALLACRFVTIDKNSTATPAGPLTFFCDAGAEPISDRRIGYLKLKTKCGREIEFKSNQDICAVTWDSSARIWHQSFPTQPLRNTG